jgi:aldehyde:ferredoxin oxidoreductase
LDVNLTDGELKERETPAALARAFLGGRGLAAALLHKELKPGTDPLSPENILIFMTGPAVGTPLPSCHRSDFTTKSPLTGSYLCSSAGGFFGPEVKFSGFDGIVVRGKAKKPVYISVVDGEAELHGAGKLWGKPTNETELAIRKELKDSRARVACIGQAGENLSKIANIVSDTRTWGRGGAGAVMGSKNLKAIAARGQGSVEVADEEGLINFVNELRQKMKENVETGENFPKWGTPQFIDPINEAGMLPTRNFQEGVFEEVEKINAFSVRKNLVKRDTACYACPIACGKLSMVTSGPYADTVVEGPEYETLWSFGPQCGVDDLAAIAAANLWCDQYGLDTISAGSTVAFAMECFERGLLTKDGTDGLELKFGNHEVFREILRRMALREGVGDLLADGTRAAAERIGKGSEDYAIHVKGLELPAYDPRGAWGMGLAYATACRGGCHLKAWTIGEEILRGNYDRLSTDGKAELVFNLQNTRAAVDSIGVCVMAGRVIGMEEMAKIMSLTTGWNSSADEIGESGERIYTLERQLAVREGIGRGDDTLPPRILNESLPGGPTKGIKLGKENLNRMLGEYYKIRGWDEEGRPTESKLSELNITRLLG